MDFHTKMDFFEFPPDYNNNNNSGRSCCYSNIIGGPSCVYSDYLNTQLAKDPNDYLLENGFSRRSKKRKGPHTHMVQRQAANLRERRRMQSINEAYEELRHHIPVEPYERRLSKVDTLKTAMKYIAFLAEVLSNDRDGDTTGGVKRGPVKEEEPVKIILQCKQDFLEMQDPDYPPVEGHSLTWARDRQPGSPDANHWTTTKTWRPIPDDDLMLEESDT
ncbi:putative Pancreas transcription factor 1 subunit alpha [Hypsibius exemplaris]|uniref:Pancreas transcription factor 1 subunit alpha n=1 Tax=Hypsibius exemplaris TaxID=2072580 RepID=A0A1W0WWQ5_HYPEX|nr:putative Pancreas transcription factor 1 subunit alpha [Hypsibius exemplaris]